jgi:hypothetical protein
MPTSASTKPRARLGVECTHLAGRIRGSDDAEEKLTALAIYGTQRVLDLAREAQTQYRKIAIEASDWKPEDGIEPLDRRGDQCEASRHDTLQAMTVDEQAVFRTISTPTTTRDVNSETKKATASANSKPSATASPSARRLTHTTAANACTRPVKARHFISD